MSIRVKARLIKLQLLDNTDHELRVELDQEIEKRTGQYCDTGIDKITDQELRNLVAILQERRRRKLKGDVQLTEEQEKEVVAYA